MRTANAKYMKLWEDLKKERIVRIKINHAHSLTKAQKDKAAKVVLKAISSYKYEDLTFRADNRATRLQSLIDPEGNVVIWLGSTKLDAIMSTILVPEFQV